MRYEIVCVKKNLKSTDAFSSIFEIGFVEAKFQNRGKTLLGGFSEDIERISQSTPQHILQKEAIRLIKNKECEFYVSNGSKEVKVIVSISSHGNEYLKTENDGIEKNNLLDSLKCYH